MIRSHKSQAIIGLLVALGIIIGNLVFPGLNVAPAFAEAKFKDVQDHQRLLRRRHFSPESPSQPR